MSSYEFRALDIAKLWFIFLIFYFPMMTTVQLGIDQEQALYYISTFNNIWLVQGRWMSYLLSSYVLPSPVIPYFTTAFFGLCAAIAYILLIIAGRLRLDLNALLGFGIFVGFPMWALLLEFPTNTATGGVGLLLCGAAAFALGEMERRARQPWLVPAQILLLASAVGIYQAFVFVYLVMGLAVACFTTDRIRALVVVTIVCAAGIALSVAIQNAVLWALSLSLQYVGNFWRLDLLTQDPVAVLSRTGKTIAQVYVGSAEGFGATLWAVPIIVGLAIAAALRRSSLAPLVLVAALLAPFPLAFVAGGTIPWRTLIAVPVALWLCAMLALNSPLLVLRRLAIAACAVVALQSIAAISQYQADRELIQKFDEATANTLYERVSQVADLSQKQNVYIYGSLVPPVEYSVPFGSSAVGSFFSWDSGNMNRMLSYMSVIGYKNLVGVGREQSKALRPLFADMPIWPAPDSVKKVDDVVLVKLSN